MICGKRIINLEKCFNTREGADRTFDDLPWRMMNEPAKSGPLKGKKNSKEEINKIIHLRLLFSH